MSVEFFLDSEGFQSLYVGLMVLKSLENIVVEEESPGSYLTIAISLEDQEQCVSSNEIIATQDIIWGP
jgi:hypothetical protein